LPQKWDSLSHAKGDEYIRKKLIGEEKPISRENPIGGVGYSTVSRNFIALPLRPRTDSSGGLWRFFGAAPECGLGLAAGLQSGDFPSGCMVPEQQLPGGLVVLSRVEIFQQRRRG
jgi:hypothetical protein